MQQQVETGKQRMLMPVPMSMMMIGPDGQPSFFFPLLFFFFFFFFLFVLFIFLFFCIVN
jgi:hypothetical protein